MKHAIGIDVGGTTVKLGLVNELGEIVARKEIPTTKVNADSQLYHDIDAAVKELLCSTAVGSGMATGGIGANAPGTATDVCDIGNDVPGTATEADSVTKATQAPEVCGIGIGVPGAVLCDGTLQGLTNIDIGVVNIEDKISTITGIKTIAGNDANFAAYGEMWTGGGRGYKNVLLVTLGTGIGGGVVVDGQILYGTNGAAGEIGHLPMVEPEDEPVPCGCGKRGCLEEYASATGVVRVAMRILESTMEPSVLRGPLTAKAVFDAARDGDAVALRVVDAVCKILGKGLAMAACITNPEVILIGGGMSKAGAILLDTTTRYFREYVYKAAKDTPIRAAQLGNDAGIVGAAGLVFAKMR